MTDQKYLISAISSKIRTDAAVQLRIQPSPTLPALTYVETNLETETFQGDPALRNYNTKGYIKLNYLFKYSTGAEFCKGQTVIQSIIDSLNGSQNKIKTLQPKLKLNYIFFHALNQDLLEEEQGKELYCSTDIEFLFQVLAPNQNDSFT